MYSAIFSVETPFTNLLSVWSISNLPTNFPAVHARHICMYMCIYMELISAGFNSLKRSAASFSVVYSGATEPMRRGFPMNCLGLSFSQTALKLLTASPPRLRGMTNLETAPFWWPFPASETPVILKSSSWTIHSQVLNLQTRIIKSIIP